MSSNTETNNEPDWQKMNLAQLLPWLSSQVNRKNFNVLLILVVFFIYYNKSEQQAAERKAEIAEMDKKQEARNEELKQEFRDCNTDRSNCEDKYEELVSFVQQYIVDSKKNN